MWQDNDLQQPGSAPAEPGPPCDFLSLPSRQSLWIAHNFYWKWNVFAVLEVDHNEVSSLCIYFSTHYFSSLCAAFIHQIFILLRDLRIPPSANNFHNYAKYVRIKINLILLIIWVPLSGFMYKVCTFDISSFAAFLTSLWNLQRGEIVKPFFSIF